MAVRSCALEDVVVNRRFWRGKRVFVTGHTGFKGGWLSLWLTDMGAEVHGYALAPPAAPNFFDICSLESRLATNTLSDVRDGDALRGAMRRAQPEIVLHLAAQPLVRYSYQAPVETYSVNVIGVVNLLEAVRDTPTVRAVINVTTDKCYENRESGPPYREDEPMGGHDPYSSSKACSELVTAAYRRSYLAQRGVQLASARAGNVIGGGDWANDRLVPDFLRAIDADRTLTVRSPEATRPWQHVLEPLSGYLALAESLISRGESFAEPWNFGPEESDARSVQWIVERLCDSVSGATWRLDETPRPHEAHWIKLDITKSKARLGWRPRWNIETALDKTLAWHRAWKSGADMAAVSLEQIASLRSTITRRKTCRMSGRFSFQATPIAGLQILQRDPLGDHRGHLERMFCRDELADILRGRSIAQINRTVTAKAGTVRGMHFQYPPHAEMKFVSCLKGEIFDVAVDVRKASSTFLAWHAEILSADNGKTLVVPEGFAHGFQTLADDCQLLYFHTSAHVAAAEGALNATDPRLGIAWPTRITEQSARDRAHPMLRDAFAGVAV